MPSAKRATGNPPMSRQIATTKNDVVPNGILSGLSIVLIGLKVPAERMLGGKLGDPDRERHWDRCRCVGMDLPQVL